MKSRGKRSCATDAAQKIKRIYDVEQKEAASRPDTNEDSSEAIPLSEMSGVSAAGTVTPSLPTLLSSNRICMVCADCRRSLFHGLDDAPNAEVCQCDENASYGCFWQEPHEKQQNLRRTFACYRANNRTYWGKCASKRGRNSVVKMEVGIRRERIRFEIPPGSTDSSASMFEL